MTRENFTQDPSRNEPAIVDEREPKEAGGNLQEEQQQSQVVNEVMMVLLKQLRQLDKWTEKSKETMDNDEKKTRGENWARSTIKLRDSRPGLHDNPHGTLISKGWG